MSELSAPPFLFARPNRNGRLSRGSGAPPPWNPESESQLPDFCPHGHPLIEGICLEAWRDEDDETFMPISEMGPTTTEGRR